MKRLLFFLLLIQLAGSACAQSLNEKLDEFMTANAKLGKFNGVALVAKNDQVLLHKEYGWRDAQKRIA